ncbi:MAG TPA: nitrate- and nitrite sensing domain-containing protein [Micromonosporaceae bacterium]|nr:nitrate- and nitrite sensing domain-containing protein [Micromonosporaceae bacterium]
MSTGPTTLPEKKVQEPDSKRRRFFRLRDARIRSKLALILVVPVVAVVALAAVRLIAIGQGALDATMVRTLTALSADISALSQDLHKERMAAAAYLSEPSAQPDSYNLHLRSTNERIAAYEKARQRIGAVPSAVEHRLQIIDAHLKALNGTRHEVTDRKQMPVSEAVLRYSVVITDLVAYGDVLGQLAGEGRLADGLRAVAAFTRAKAAAAEQEAVTFAALSSGQLDEEQFASFVATLTSQQEALVSFSLAASSWQRGLVERVVTGDAVVLADRISAEVTRSVGKQPLVTATEAARAIGAVNDLMRWAEAQLEERLHAQAEQVRADVVRQAIVESVAVLLALTLAIALAVILARSLNHSLRRLREGALSVANRDLPDAVARLRDVGDLGDGGVEEIVRQVRDPIRLSNRDEIGQVAQAFNVVHREAVRIAAEQAALRTSVSAMFLNLARRSQALVDRMIGELDLIERSEEDPKRLAKLFELDHLATRMRRNDENLLVLAGADSAPPRREDALLADILQAAQSEVELYNRVEFGTVDPDISVSANAVNDVVRLVAELLDNGTRFSPPTTAVIADARRIHDYVILQVEDRGLGMTDEQMDDLNRRLAAPPGMDVAAFRLMGLAVVSRLASRYGIRVELRRNPEGGTVAQVTLPSSIVVLPRSRGREQLLPRPRQPLAVEQGPSATPAAAPVSAPSQGGWTAPAAPAVRPSSAAFSEQWPGQWGPAASPTPSSVPTMAPTSAPMNPAPMATPVPMAPMAPTPAPVMAQVTAEYVTAAPAVTHPLSPTVAPPSGLPSGPVAGLGAALAATSQEMPVASAPRKEDAGELPIFREMEAVWFRTHGQDATQIFTMPPIEAGPPPGVGTGSSTTAQIPTMASAPLTYDAPTSAHGTLPPRPGQAAPSAPLPTRTPGQAAPPPSAEYPAATGPVGAAAPATSQPRAGQEAWRTAADEGWQRASQAAAPTDGGTTQSGLPKRVPQAQLVPGGVETKVPRDRTRRTPDEVRGLLSAYHRGVQRGRSAGIDQHGNSTKEHSG